MLLSLGIRILPYSHKTRSREALFVNLKQLFPNRFGGMCEFLFDFFLRAFDIGKLIFVYGKFN